MIRLYKFALVAALAWSAYWYIAGYTIRQGVSGWFTEQVSLGWQADYAGLSTSGYPLRHVTTLENPALADPTNGTAWRADWLDLDSPAIWPGSQRIHFPPSPQRLSYLDQTVVLQARDMLADLHLTPGVDLVLERMALSSGPFAVSGQDGHILAAESLNVEMSQEDQPETYHFGVDAAQFTPGENVRKLARNTAALPASFEDLKLDMSIRFDRPWDRRALEKRRPQPVGIDLRLAQANWGALSLFAAGQMTIDGNGIPTGTVSVRAENWRDMLAMAQASGAIPELALEPTAKVLNMLSRISGNSETLDVELSLKNGFVSLGPFPIGPAPHFYLR